MSGRIPQAFIDDLLARVNIVDVIDGRVKLKKAGKNYAGLCPFHQENTPSFSVSPDKQFYYCFGCGAGGNAIGFLMEYERLSFPEAVESLARLAGIDIPREEHSHQRPPEHKGQYQILAEATAFYQQQLRQHPERQVAVDYLKQRGLSGEIASRYGLGYAPPGWDNLLKQLGATAQQQTLLEQTGLLIHNEEKNRLYDRFRERIMFPIRDVRGRTIAFGGRVLGDDKPKYLNSPETDTFHKNRELYGLYEARRQTSKLERIIIVEGYMDVISLAQFGITYAVATLGTATSAHHLQRLFKIVNQVVFCFDGDQAGRQAAQRAMETTLPVIEDEKEARFLFLPEGEDPDTQVRTSGPAAFTTQLDEALELSEFFFRHYSTLHDLGSIGGRANFSTQVLPGIQQMQPGLRQQMMLSRLSELTGLSLEQLSTTINLNQSAPPISSPATSKPSPSVIAPSAITAPAMATPLTIAPLCSHIISLLLHYPELAQKLPEQLSLTQLQDPQADLLMQLLHYLQATPGDPFPRLLIDWQDDPQLRHHLLQLSEISRLDPVMNGDPNRLFDDAWQRLSTRLQEGELIQLQKKPFATLTPAEKQRLATLIARK